MAGGILIGPAYLSAEETKFFITRPGFETDEFKMKISDAEHNILFLVKGASTKFHKQRILVDYSSGNTILTLRMKWRSMHQRWQAFRGASKKARDLLFTTKKSSEKPAVVQAHLESFDLHVCRGNSDHVSYFVRKLGKSRVVHQYTQNMAMVSGDEGKLSPNVDMAFTVSLMVIVDAMIQQQRQSLTTDLIVSKLLLRAFADSLHIDEVFKALKHLGVGELLDEMADDVEEALDRISKGIRKVIEYVK